MGFFQSGGILNRKGFFGGTTAAPFSPSDISGLQLWLDATTGLFDATSGGNAVTTDGSAVARWEDQSGNGRHVTQSTSNNRPVLKTAIQNSKNIVRFDGSNDVLTRSSFLFSQPSSSVFIAMSSNCATDRRLLCECSTTISNPIFGLVQSDLSVSTELSIFYRYDSSVIAINHPNLGTAFDNTFRLIAITDSQTVINSYINKVSTGTVAYSRGPTSVNNFCIGALQRSNLGSAWAGDVAEVIIYNSVLSQSDRDRVSDYLYAKWAIV